MLPAAKHISPAEELLSLPTRHEKQLAVESEDKLLLVAGSIFFKKKY